MDGLTQRLYEAKIEGALMMTISDVSRVDDSKEQFNLSKTAQEYFLLKREILQNGDNFDEIIDKNPATLNLRIEFYDKVDAKKLEMNKYGSLLGKIL